MGPWSRDSKTHVATMTDSDFRSNERSRTMAQNDVLRIELTGKDGKVTVLKEKLPVLAAEVVDGTVMSARALTSFLEKEIEDARQQGVLFSVHLKANMMKFSEPIIFGQAVKTFFKDVFQKHSGTFLTLGVTANNGLGSLLEAIRRLPDAQRAEIETDLA